MESLNQLIGNEHNPGLVLIAFLIAVLASYTVLDLAARVNASQGARRRQWLIAGAVVMGTGIWSMHFTAMLAFKPPFAVFYHWPTVLLSWVVAWVPCGIALNVVAKDKISWSNMVLSGSCMGVGVGTMHYVGMEAMRFHVLLAYDMTIFLISIGIAIFASVAALWLAITFRKTSSSILDWYKVGSAFIMGIAISGMHHVGMNAAIFTQLVGEAPLSYPFSVSIDLIGATAIIAITTIMLGFALTMSVVDQKLRIQEGQLQISKGEILRSHSRLEQHLDDLKRVQKISTLCMSSLNPEVLIQSVLEQLLALFPFSDLLYYKFDQEKNSLQFYSHLAQEDYGEERNLVFDDRLVFDAAFKDCSLWQSVENDGSQFGRSEIALPVKHADQILGIIAVLIPHTAQDKGLKPEQIEILELIADQMAMSLQNAELFSEAIELQEKANAANQIKTEFLSTMTHELRTPLNGVLGLTNILLDSALNEDQKDLVNTIQFSGDSLLNIINDILDFSKIESNQIDLEIAPINLRNCIEETLEFVAPTAAEKQINVAYLIDKNVPIHIFQDLTRVRQVLTNLMSNAVKFTQKGEVYLTVSAARVEVDRYKLEFALKDTGVGISEEGLKRLFKSFSQVDGSLTRRFGGTGLGLVISKRLCELMGGSIWVESELGVGSTFYFSMIAERDTQESLETFSMDGLQYDQKMLLDIQNQTNRNVAIDCLERWGIGYKFSQGIPRDWEPEREGVLITDRQEQNLTAMLQTFPKIKILLLSRRGYKSDTGHLNLSLSPLPIRPHVLSDQLERMLDSSEASQKAQARPLLFDRDMGQEFPLRILVADDNVINQKVALNMLKRLGYRADVANNGIEALEALEIKKYDLILMDTQMPGMNGAETAREIHNRLGGGLSGRPWIIALTSNLLTGNPQAYVEAGMDDYLSKPLRVNELIAALKKVPRRENLAQ